CLVEVQFVPVGDHHDLVIHGSINSFAILVGSLAYASDFVPVTLPLFGINPKILGGRFVHVTVVVKPRTPFNLLNNQILHNASFNFALLILSPTPSKSKNLALFSQLVIIAVVVEPHRHPMAHSRRTKPGLPYLRTDPETDSGRHRSRVKSLVLARQVKGSGRAVRDILVLAAH